MCYLDTENTRKSKVRILIVRLRQISHNEKKPDSTYELKVYERIKLYRDDIDLILSIFHENEYTVQITDKEFQFDSLEELIDKRGIAPSYFEIYGRQTENNNESLRVSFDKEKIHIHVYLDVQKTSKIIFAQIRDICESRMSKIYKILNPWLYFSALILSVLFLSLWGNKGTEKSLSEYNTWVIILLTVFPAAMILSFLYRTDRRQVILRRKHEGGFWKQNSNKIWLLILGALIGIFIKFILDLIWKAI